MVETLADILQKVKEIVAERPELKDRLSQIYIYAKDQVKAGSDEKKEASFASDDIEELLSAKEVPTGHYKPSRQQWQVRQRTPAHMMQEGSKAIALLRSIGVAVKKLQK